MHRSDRLLGVLELDPGAIYPPHRHATPEVYYVTQGVAECQFGDEQFIARPGTAIHTEPNVAHGFKNIGQEKFVAVGFWWAPGGDKDAVNCDLVLLEQA